MLGHEVTRRAPLQRRRATSLDRRAARTSELTQECLGSTGMPWLLGCLKWLGCVCFLLLFKVVFFATSKFRESRVVFSGDLRGGIH